MKKQYFLIACLSVLVTVNAMAQKSSSFNTSDYESALGIKLYPGSRGFAVTYKHFVKEGVALEALGSIWERGTRATGLYEFHWDIDALEGLKWYAGPGFHIGVYNDKYYNDVTEGGSYFAVGLDGVIGLDYKFHNIPLNLSADWQPYFEFGNQRYNGFSGDFGGITARYTF